MNQDIRQSNETGQVQFLADTLPVMVQTCPVFSKDCTVKKIKLTQDRVALVNDIDYPKLSKYKWHIMKKASIYHLGYAQRSIYKNGKIYSIFMHREIMGLVRGDKRQIDHINHNGLDNRRCNLRICTSAENHYNRKKTKGTSKYKGVMLCKYDRWRAMIVKNRKNYYLGYFDNEIEAAKIYDKKANELFGEFANLNKEK